MFREDLADIQLKQLLDVFQELEPPFKEYIVSQIKQLIDVVHKQRAQSTPQGKKRPSNSQ
jgi:hypothetical protein